MRISGTSSPVARRPLPTPSVGDMAPDVVAAVDCGTNSTRLLVARRGPAGLETLERRMTITRLGAGVDATGRLDPAAITRTTDVLAEYRNVLDAFDVVVSPATVRAAATSAARDAANRDDFFAVATDALGVTPELLSGTEEAALSFTGATADLDPALGPFLVVDIGGGSTEFVLGRVTADGTPEVAGVLSVDLGCVRVTERFLHADPPLPEELSAALSVVQLHLDDVVREIPGASAARTLVGLAGTVSATASVELGLAAYDRDAIHHFVLTKAAAEDVFRTLATEALADRLHNPGLEAQRADVIVGGLCVLVGTLRHLGFSECLVSEADILDGLAMSLLAGPAGA
jgi:exopolyphosphatase/guanosine-5'-triphosphate,3'-diphosphate pyrophosphatase